MGINTLTDIANVALGAIGYGNSIADIATNSKPASQIRVQLDSVIDTVLGEFWWQELMTERSLVADATERDDERFEYSLPLDYLRLKATDARDYEIRGDKLITPKEAPVKILYLRYSDNVGEWSFQLKECVHTLLASKLAIVLKEDDRRATQFEQRYHASVLPRAKTTQSKDNQSAKDREAFQGSWIRRFHANR